MTKDIMLYLERKMKGNQDSRRMRSDNRRSGNRREEDYENEDNRGYSTDSRRSRDERDYNRRARAPRGDVYNEDYEDDYHDYEDGEDYHHYKHIKLTKADFTKWEKMLHNADGTHGPHYSYEQAIMAAEKIGIRFDSYTEREFYICLNMMYADYGTVAAKHMPPEKVLQYLAEMAKAFFDDPDGPEPSEKLALYFHCVVCCATE